MAGNRYDDEVPTTEEAGRALAATAQQPSPTASPAVIPVAPGASSSTMGVPASFIPAPGVNRYDDPPPAQGPQEQVQLSGESAEAPDQRMEEYKQLPSIWQAPALRTPGGAVAFGTNSSVDDIEKMLQKDIPGVTVERDNGARIYTFPGDPQKYAWVPGTVMPSDIARAVPGVVGSIGAGMAVGGSAPLTVPAAIVANVVQSLLGEGAKAAVGMDPSALNVGVAAGLPIAGAGAKWLAQGTGKLAGGLVSKLVAPRGPAAESLVDPLVQKGQDVLVKLGADADLGRLAQDVAGITEPAVNAARNTASKVAADVETDIATAAAKEQADKAAAGVVATTAQDKAREVATDAATTARYAMQDKIAAAATKAETNVAAANAPVDSVVDSTIQAVQAWGAGKPSSFDAGFIGNAVRVLKDMKKQVNTLYGKVRKLFPEDARVTPRKAYDDLRKTIAKVTKGQSKEAQSPMVKKVKRVMFPPKAKNGNVRMPRVGDVIAMSKYASKAGKIGTEFAGEDPATMRTIGKALRKLWHDMARDFGAGALLDKAKAKAAEQLAFQKKLKAALGLRGGKALADASAIPARNRAATAMINGNLEPLRVIMNGTPPGMKQEVMANVVQRAVNPLKGPEHMVAVINAIRDNPEINEIVFKNLPPGARAKLLGVGADMERALLKRADDVVKAKAAQETETLALKRGTDKTLQTIQDTERMAIRAARDTEADAISKAAQKKADAVSAAKIREQAAQEALKEAERLNIALAPKLKAAGTALRNGDIRPFDEMLKSAPGKETEVAASTLYHTLFDPTKKGPEALKHMTDALVDLEANPTVMRRVKSFLPNAMSDIEVVTDLAKIVHSGTAAGGKKAEGWLAALANMGPWAAGRTVGTAAGIATGMAGGGFATSAGVGVGATVLGRVLMSRFVKDPTIETKAANALLASDVGRGLLKHLALDKPITQGYLNRLAASRPVQAAARVYGMRPERFIRKLAYGSGVTLREMGEQALAPNNAKEDE